MRKIFTFLFLALVMCTFTDAVAQNPERMSPKDRAKFLAEIKNYKHDFLTEELGLTKDQQRDFFPVYDRMEEEISRLNAETRELERKIESDGDASEVELEAASRAIFEQKGKEGAVEMEYYDKFKTILDPRQLFNLKIAERKFTQDLMRHHRRLYKNQKR